MDRFARRAAVVCAFGAIVLIAAVLRLPALDARPMHADEAVHAAKFGRLLEQGRYEYDPREYHGPTLYYLTLVPARLLGVARYADLGESTLRIVPAAAGLFLVAAHLLLVPILGFRAAALAALFAAVSPAMVYYSRYYIQETLLAAFSCCALVSICRYVRSPRPGWALAAGASVGLMFATKETWIIAFGSMASALVVAWALDAGRDAFGVLRRQPGRRAAWMVAARGQRLPTAAHLAAAALPAVVLSATFFSSFFTHPRGVVDSIAAYTTYLDRGAGASWHVYPWHYYVRLLAYWRMDDGPIWTEAAILGLAIAGFVVAFSRHGQTRTERRVLSFLAVYALLMAIAYCAIPYKTPWCVLGFLHGFILLAGVGGSRLMAALSRPLAATLFATLLAAAVAHQGWLAWAVSTRYAADPRNPWVYAHTGAGVFEITRHLEDLARADARGRNMPIEVISGENLWPLPWYLRRFSAVRWETAPVNDGFHAPVILTTSGMESAVATKLYEWRRPGEREMYVPIFDGAVELRPQLEIRGFAAKTLWDVYRER